MEFPKHMALPKNYALLDFSRDSAHCTANYTSILGSSTPISPGGLQDTSNWCIQSMALAPQTRGAEVSRAKAQRKLRLTLAGLMAALIVGLYTTPATASTTPYATNIYTGPSYYYRLVGTTLSGWYVRMNCWIDSSTWAYGSNRWFHISTTGWSPYTGRLQGMSGFVPANRVTQQTATPRCW